jgi:hypothetical protein
MAVGIVIPSPPEKHYLIRTRAQAARGRVRRENRQEYDNEKRAKELERWMPDGHVDAKAVAIAKMMGIDEHQAKALVKRRSKGMVLDGKID